MTTIFDRLTDLGLRRLFKFVLKRSIGKYLSDELLLDQLHVHCREGIVKVNNLQLNCTLLNDEYLTNSGIILDSFSVVELEAKISYTSVLSEGCQFHARGVNVVIKSAGDRVGVQSAQPSFTTGLKSDHSTNECGEVDVSPEGQEGLHFIANWIEILVASLKIEVILLDSVSI